jgi:hypothetical protein
MNRLSGREHIINHNFAGKDRSIHREERDFNTMNFFRREDDDQAYMKSQPINEYDSLHQVDGTSSARPQREDFLPLSSILGRSWVLKPPMEVPL